MWLIINAFERNEKETGSEPKFLSRMNDKNLAF
jgi:hypothetical protein